MEISEPELVQTIETMDRMGIDPMRFIKFVGDTAVWRGANDETNN